MGTPVLGPMENADPVGLELTCDVHRVVYPELHAEREPSPMLDRLIAEAHVGMKSGQGLRSWPRAQGEQVQRRLIAHLIRLAEQGPSAVLTRGSARASNRTSRTAFFADR